MASVVQADHDFHCTFMSWGFPTEDSCLCCPLATDEFREVWGQDLMDWIGATLSLPEVSKSWQPETWCDPEAANPEEHRNAIPTNRSSFHSSGIPYFADSSQVGVSTDSTPTHYPRLERTYFLEPIRPVTCLGQHPIPSEVCPPTFYPADNQLACQGEDSIPLYYPGSPSSSSADSHIPSSDVGTPQESSCTSDSADSGAESCTPELKRKRDIYEGDLVGLDQEGNDDNSDSSIVIPQTTRRRRTTTNGSPNYTTDPHPRPPRRPIRSDKGSLILTKTIARLSPIPFKLNVHALDEYKPRIHVCLDHAPPEPSEVSATCLDCAHAWRRQNGRVAEECSLEEVA